MILDTFSLFITMEWPLLSFFSYISYPEHSTDTQTVCVSFFNCFSNMWDKVFKNGPSKICRR